ncbi:MAG: SMC-Scp complex subunit ScpB [Mariprofundaceae bacterium]|nr:SMC-Scp complex subunit ScpB [Mariprofundaceae bacterium]
MSLINQVEALILASDEPLTLQKLRTLLEEASSSELREVLSTLESNYSERGINLVQVGGGWQFQTSPDYSETVSKLWETRPSRLSRSMLETLAIIAYRQPTTRAEIEALRGMRVSSSVLGGLQERGWVKVTGRKEVPGRPHLYGTGRAFLTDFGLGSLRDLPDSSQLLDEDEVIESIEAQLAESGQLSGTDANDDEEDECSDATANEGNHAETEEENSAL